MYGKFEQHLENELQAIRDAGFYKTERVITTPQGSHVETEAGGTSLVMTGDRDMFQCASDSVTVLYVSTGKQGGQVMGPAQVKERYGIPPKLVPDLIALRGFHGRGAQRYADRG